MKNICNNKESSKCICDYDEVGLQKDVILMYICLSNI